MSKFKNDALLYLILIVFTKMGNTSEITFPSHVSRIILSYSEIFTSYAYICQNNEYYTTLRKIMTEIGYQQYIYMMTSSLRPWSVLRPYVRFIQSPPDSTVPFPDPNLKFPWVSQEFYHLRWERPDRLPAVLILWDETNKRTMHVEFVSTWTFRSRWNYYDNSNTIMAAKISWWSKQSKRWVEIHIDKDGRATEIQIKNPEDWNNPDVSVYADRAGPIRIMTFYNDPTQPKKSHNVFGRFPLPSSMNEDDTHAKSDISKCIIV